MLANIRRASKISFFICLLLSSFLLRAQAPDWTVNSSAFANSMNVIGFLKLDNIESNDVNDIVGAFINGELRGSANPIYVSEIDRFVVFLTIYSNQTSGTVSFKAYDDSNDAIVDIVTTVAFQPDALIGGLNESYIWSNIELNSEAQMSAFSLPIQIGQTEFDNDTIRLNVQLTSGQSLNEQIATFTVSDKATVEIDDVQQVSGTTSNDFSTVLHYQVQSEDLSTIRDYYVKTNIGNVAPTDISLSNNVINENLSASVTIGDFTAIDQDQSDTHVYALIEGVGDDNNDLFSISNNSLLAATAFDYEVQSALSIRVRATDANGLSVEKSITININDQNDAPTAIALSNSSIDENGNAGEIVGALSTTDQDVNDSHTYSLVSGYGSTDNGRFRIEAGNLVSEASFNHEQVSTFSVRVRSEDSSGERFEQILSVNVTDVQEAPDDISLSTTSIDENMPNDSVVGSFSTSDEDEGDAHVYTLVQGNGDTDNALFNISNNSLLATVLFDYETQNEFSIRVRTTDANGLSFEKPYTISVNDLNERPDSFSLSSASINENNSINSVAASFSTIDEDKGDTHVYALVQGDGDDDNSLFTISNNSLLPSVSFNYETQPALNIRVRATDAHGLSIEQSFAISVIDLNEAPNSFSLSSVEIDENSPNNAVIGSFTTTDEDEGDSHVYALTTGNGDDDNGLFSIINNSLVAPASFDYEKQNELNIRIKVTDASGLSIEQSFSISVIDLNERPDNISLSSAFINENSPINSFIGSFSAEDEDKNDTHVYSLVQGDGDDDNDLFTISNNSLLALLLFDYEAQNELNIRVKATDTNGLSVEKSFVVSVRDQNDSPTAISLSNSSINENRESGTVVGLLLTTDQDANDSYAYTLVPGFGSSDNGKFRIESGNLLSDAVFNYEETTTLSIRVRSADLSGESVEQILTINVANVNDVPSNVNLSSTAISENEAQKSVIGLFNTEDEDAGNTHAYTLVEGDGDDDNVLFSISNDSLLSAASFDYEAQNELNIRVRSTDVNGLFVEKSFLVSVNDTNEIPEDVVLSSASINENAPNNSIVGSFITEDVDQNDRHNYSLAQGEGDDDNVLFTLLGNSLLSATTFDYEDRNVLKIRVKATDVNGLSIEKPLLVSIKDQNDEPTAISLSSSSIDENQNSGTIIGSLLTADQDAADMHSYSLIEGSGSTDNAKFRIESSKLLSNDTFNHEELSILSIRVRSEDSSGESIEQILTINVSDINDAPENINLSSSSINENAPINSIIGSLTTEDEDEFQTYDYELISGDGSADNGLFGIRNNQLVARNSFDFEGKSQYNIRVAAISGEDRIEKQFDIIVLDREDAPTSIQLSTSSIDENNDSGENIGYFIIEDQDTNESYDVVLKANTADNNYFGINNRNKLFAKTSFDFEEKQSYQIVIEAIDGQSNRYEWSFVINVINQDEPAIQMSQSTIDLEPTFVGESVSGQFIITNSGTDGDLDIELIELPENFTIDPIQVTLANKTSQTFTLTYTPLEEETLTQLILIRTNIGEFSLEVNASSLVTSLERLPDFSDKVVISPNPASDRLNINTDIFQGVYDAYLYSLTNGQIQSEYIGLRGRKASMHLGTVANGMYLLVLRDEDIIVKKKVIVKR